MLEFCEKRCGCWVKVGGKMRVGCMMVEGSEVAGDGRVKLEDAVPVRRDLQQASGRGRPSFCRR